MKITALSLFILLATLPITNAEDWPHWRGTNRTDITTETSAFSDETKSWPTGSALWKKNVGVGASSPIVVGKIVYTLGWEKGKNILRALDAATGETIWEQAHPAPRYGRHAVGDMGQYTGTTATPEFDPATGFIYTLSADGDLHARDTTKNGALIWSLNLYEKYGIGQRPQITKRKNTRRDYGYTCAPLVHENWVIIEVGDPKTGNLHAFDKRTGKPVWTSENRDIAGHSGGIAPMIIDGVPCLAIATSYHALVVRVDGKNAGQTVAEFPWKTDFSNTIAGIAARRNELLIGSHYNQNAMVKVAISLSGGATEVWRNAHPTGVCTPVIHGNHLYFANKGVHCIDFNTGKQIWEGGKVGHAGSCLITADERLIVWANGGDLSLVETTKRSPEKYTQLALKRAVLNETAWPHVVLANRRIYCKTTDGALVCFSLKNEQPAKSTTTGAPAPVDLNYTAWGEDQPEGLLWSWKQGNPLVKPSRAMRRAKLEAKGSATLTKAGALHLNGGSFQLKGASTVLHAACQKSNAFTIEIVLHTDDLKQRGPARIISFSKDAHHRNFTLGQQGENLILRLRTTATGDNGSNPETTLFEMEPSRLNRVCITYQQGMIVAYHNGKPVMRSDKVTGDFSTWAADYGFLFGDEWGDGNRNWHGTIHAVALFGRALTEAEVAEKDQLLAE